MYCPHCGAQVNAEDEFCPQCGGRLRHLAIPAQETLAPAEPVDPGGHSLPTLPAPSYATDGSAPQVHAPLEPDLSRMTSSRGPEALACASDPARRNPGWARWVVVGVILAFLLCCCCLAFWVFAADIGGIRQALSSLLGIRLPDTNLFPR
jgi:hypothetical protein